MTVFYIILEVLVAYLLGSVSSAVWIGKMLYGIDVRQHGSGNAGATNVIMPERIGGQRMAKLVTQPDVVEFVEYILLQQSKDVSLEEISCARMATFFVNKPLKVLYEKNKSGINIVGLKISGVKYVFNPSPELTLSRGDQRFVLGSPTHISEFRNMLENQK